MEARDTALYYLLNIISKLIDSRSTVGLTVYCFCGICAQDMWSPDGSCFPLCNLLNNSMTSNDVDRKKKKSENVSGCGTPSSIEIHFYEIMVSRDNDMCYSELLW